MHSEIDFTDFYEKLFSLLPDGNIQHLMDLCYSYVGLPILTVDIMYHVLGIAPNEPTGEYMWDTLLKEKGFEPEHIARLYQDGIIQSADERKEAYVVDWGICEQNPRIQGLIRINGVLEGYVTMSCQSHEDITPDRMKAMNIIASVCAFFVQASENRVGNHSTHYRVFLNQLFENEIQTQEQLENWTRNIRRPVAPPYAVSIVRAADSRRLNLYSYLLKSIEQISDRQLLTIKDHQLFILHYNYTPENRIYLDSLEYELKKLDASAGFSNEFFSLLTIAPFIRQAKDALDYGSLTSPTSCIHHYQENTLQAILGTVIHTMPECSYQSPLVRRMMDYDQANLTDYCDTIRSFVMHMCNATNTAKALNIHRNTLLYRVEKAESLFEFSLKDNRCFLHLMISFYARDLTQAMQKNPTVLM